MPVPDAVEELTGEDRLADREAIQSNINTETASGPSPMRTPKAEHLAGTGQLHPSATVQAWRVIFVAVLVALGAALGFLLGQEIVRSVRASTTDQPLIAAYHTTLSSQLGAYANIAGYTLIGALVAFILASAVFNKIVGIGEALRRMSINEKFAILIGIFFGLVITALISQVLLTIPRIGILVTILVGVMLTYLGVVMMQNVKLEELIPTAKPTAAEDEAQATAERIKLLDTNVIIDGRVADVCRTGFIEGPIYVPGFVLDELQHIADSPDALKRARGRRGLDILNQMRSELPLIVRTLDAKAEYAHAEEVDARLVKLARKLEGAIVTNDFNLNKVAELQGVPVLNINELANALKPVVLPGEEMRTTVIKEGKEMNQGIAYLDDGTMIVIEGARRRIGETLDVIVSSVLQTVAGKMIFATIKQNDDGMDEENGDRSDDHGSQGPRGYSGGRSRRPIR
ncbi:MAG TPA: PIN domain-containing protein [Capsulimonadaceae bacterium]|nr:PIN domain-containing protein [Capsulimonadaceae bacterium]